MDDRLEMIVQSPAKATTFSDASPGALLIGRSGAEHPVLGIKAVDHSAKQFLASIRFGAPPNWPPITFETVSQDRLFLDVSESHKLVPDLHPETYTTRGGAGMIVVRGDAFYLCVAHGDGAYVNLHTGALLASRPSDRFIATPHWWIVAPDHLGRLAVVYEHGARKPTVA